MGLLLAALATPVHAAPPSAQADAADIAIDDGLGLRRLADMAVARAPRAVMQDAYDLRAQAEQRLSDRLFPESARLSGYHLSDRPLDDTGLVEDEIALSMPLWMPGEKRARSQLADALSEGLQSHAAELRWQVAGALRHSLWDVVIARRDAALARAQEARLAGVLRETVELERTGDLARGDRLLVEQELGQWKAETIDREARYQDAIRAYRALTGVATLPADYQESLSPREHIDGGHPALRSARDRMAEAQAALDVVREGNTSRPSLQLFWRASRPEDVMPRTSALGIGFEIPLGRSPIRAPEIAQTNELLAAAEAEFLSRQRKLELLRHEAEHELHTLELQLANSEAMLEAAQERQSIDRLAFELGELGMREWLRREAEFKDIERSHELLGLQHGAAIAAYNQAVGDVL